MSSRQEEKARRRAEREAAEAAARRREATQARLQLALGGAVAVAAVVVAVLVFGGSGGGRAKSADASAADAPKVAVPALRQTNLAAAERTAGCVQLNPPSEGRTHVTTTVTYRNSNPPASGPHNPVPASDGLYDPGNEPAKEHWVHSLEHGRVEIQYRPGTAAHVIDQLETVGSEPLNGSAGYHVLVFENNTRMPYQVAAVAWTHVLGCKRMNDRVFDAIRAFRKQYTDKGPEIIPGAE